MDEKAAVNVRVMQQIEAPAERVFDAWMKPELIGKWMFGPSVRDEEIVRLHVDARVGGRFSFVVRRQGQEIDHVGEYLELARPTRLAFTWGIANSDSSRVTVEIAPKGGGCEVVLTHVLHPDWAHFASRTEAGWAKMLEALAKALG
jgi:uncharacterized protein YndB with AHSA1/START domain